MFGGCPAVDQNNVEINDRKFSVVGTQNFIHQSHEGAGGIGEAEWHDEPFVKSSPGFECHLPFVSCADPHLVIAIPLIKLGEYGGSGELIEKVIDARDGKTITYYDAIDRSTIYAQSLGAVLLGCKEGRDWTRAVTFPDETAMEQFLDLSLKLCAL